MYSFSFLRKGKTEGLVRNTFLSTPRRIFYTNVFNLNPNDNHTLLSLNHFLISQYRH